MNYQLAKELKDAGFPQTGAETMNHELDVFLESDGSLCRAWNRLEKGARVPHLEELIEACGNVISLMVGKDKTVALNETNPMESTSRGEGATPTEAVARLWLSLHTKQGT